MKKRPTSLIRYFDSVLRLQIMRWLSYRICYRCLFMIRITTSCRYINCDRMYNFYSRLKSKIKIKNSTWKIKFNMHTSLLLPNLSTFFPNLLCKIKKNLLWLIYYDLETWLSKKKVFRANVYWIMWTVKF